MKLYFGAEAIVSINYAIRYTFTYPAKNGADCQKRLKMGQNGPKMAMATVEKGGGGHDIASPEWIISFVPGESKNFS